MRWLGRQNIGWACITLMVAPSLYAQPLPPDVTPPYIADQNPAPSATNVDVNSQVRFCAYDADAGVDTTTITVTLDDTGGPVVYSAVATPSNFAATVNSGLCTSGNDGANTNGVLVVVTPLAAFPNNVDVTVTPAFSDLAATPNAYAGGNYLFHTATGLPPPPDSTAPYRADENPASGATGVAVTTQIRFCAYDAGAGVDITSIQLTVDDTVTPRTYSASLTPTYFSALADSPSCLTGNDGANTRGILVTVTPLAALPNNVTVTVTPAFVDMASPANAYAGGSYSFQTVGSADLVPPYRANENPAPLATNVDINSQVQMCLYDAASGVDTTTIQVAIFDTATNVTYSASLTPSNFSATSNSPTCASGNDGVNTYGVLVVVTPQTAFPNNVDVTVTPAFSDQASNAYTGGAYSFHTATGLPLPPDSTPPYRADEVPAPTQINVPIASTVELCLYDAGAGVLVSSIEITIDDTTGPVTYSATLTPANFTATANDPTCATGNDGTNTYGVKVTVTPQAAFPLNVDVTVTPALTDNASPPNAYAGGPYSFHTELPAAIDPLVLIVNPAENAVVGGLTLVRVDAYDPANLDAITPVQVSFNNLWDAANRITLATENTYFGFDLDPTRGVYDLFWDTVAGVTADDALTQIGAIGPDASSTVTIYVRAIGADAAFTTAVRQLSIRNQGGQPAGAGNLLRREAGSTLCVSCHDVKTHSSASLGTKYGNWGFECLHCHTPHGTPNLMLIRQQIDTPNSGTHSVDLRDVTSGVIDYGLAEADLGANGNSGVGVCETCHTKTQNADATPRYRNTGGGGNGHPTSRCTACHDHKSGFKGLGSCNGCHNAPPTTPSLGNVHATHDGSGAVPTAYGLVANNSTATYYSFSCGKCHPSAAQESTEHRNSTGAGTMADPKVVQINGFFDDTTDPKIVGATFTAGASTYTELGPGGEYFQYSNGTCSNVYCHGAFAGGNATNTPVFTAGNQPCGSCHGASQATPPSGGSHAAHVGTQNLPCQLCHQATADATPAIIDKSKHVDGATTWALLTTDARIGAAGTYSASAAGSKNPPSAVYGNCSVYCHSNGNPVTGSSVPYNVSHSPQWGGIIAGGCVGCHGNDAASGQLIGASATLKGSLAHQKHVGTYGFKCDDCHNTTVQDRTSNTTLTPAQTTHPNGAKTVDFSTWPADQTGGSWEGTGHTCSNTYCHSRGTTSTPPFVAPLATADWDNLTTTCNSCHDQASATSTTLSGAHFKHTQIGGYAFPCERCHGLTVTGSSTIANYSVHVDGAKTFYLKGAPNMTDGTGTLGATCSSVYCHSAGNDFSAPFADAKTINWSSSTTCTSCHGGATPAPAYANGSPKANSHARHNFTCDNCHASVVDSTPAIIDKTLHVNGVYNLAPGGSVSFTPAVGQPGIPTTCSNISCHGNNVTPIAWGSSLVCLDCHTGTEANFTKANIRDGTPNAVDDEWTTKGHGNTLGANFTSALGGCDYCHDVNASHVPTDPTNPYRLRTDTVGGYVFSASDNSLCLACHGANDATDPGISVSAAGIALTPKDDTRVAGSIGTAHWGTKHAGVEGGERCWDCHDPHGDPNIKMIKQYVTVNRDATDAAYGVPGSGVDDTHMVAFTADALYSDFVKTTGAAPRQGMCQACHNPSKPGTESTKYWRWDGTDDPDGAGGAAPVTSAHNQGTVCTTCHDHTDNWAGKGNDCLGCHRTVSQQGTYKRRPVGADFSKQSHHVGNGGSFMGGTLTNFDCVVCHKEGDPNGAEVATSDIYHGGNGGSRTIDLRNADTGAALSYDKYAVCIAAGGTDPQCKDTNANIVTPLNWRSGNTTWETETSTKLDVFCLSCHDSDGASLSFNATDGGSALNPFGDAMITNEYDQQNRTRIVNIKDMVAGNPPVDGQYARHAIRGQAASVYSTANANWNSPTYWATDAGSVQWNETKQMGCPDCHTTDGANGPNGNAHGSGSEYLLKDESGTAVEGQLSLNNYMCYLCHAKGNYGSASAHSGNGNNYQAYEGNTGSARVPTGNTGGSIFAMPCTNCHGGAPGNGETAAQGFGRLHGTSQTFNTGSGGGSGTRQAYRFTNGSSLRFYDPQGWTGSSGSCYTLGTGDSFGGCTKHSGSAGGLSKNFSRPLTY